jgi:CRP/FNR family transcriptional regulator, cyclic AMP receptor protein
METTLPSRIGEGETIPSASQRLPRILRDMGLTGIDRLYEAGEILYAGGTGSDALHLILEGIVRISRTYPGGKEATLGLLGVGEAFGCPIFSGHSLSSFYAEALTSCTLIRVPKPLLDGAVKRSPRLAGEVMALKDRQLDAYEKLVGRLLTRRTPIRLADLLLELDQKFGVSGPTEGYPRTIGLRLTHEDLGTMVASTRESISAAMGELRRAGAVSVVGGLIVIVNPNLLVRLIEETGMMRC